MIAKYKPGFTPAHRENRPDIRTTESDQAGDGTVVESTDDHDADDAPGESGPPDADEDDKATPKYQ